MSEITNIGTELKLADTLSFGKYKGRTIENVLSSDGAYLVWLREVKKEKKNFFAAEVHPLLNLKIVISKTLRSKYKMWDESDIPSADEPVIAPLTEAPAAIHNEGWGSF